MVHSTRRSQRDQLPGMAMKHIDSPSAKVQPIGTGAHIDREVSECVLQPVAKTMRPRRRISGAA